MAKQVKTNAKDVKAKQAERDKAFANGKTRHEEPVEQDPQAATIQACADALVEYLTVHGPTPELEVVAELTDHKKYPALWTSTAVDKAMELLVKEQQILCCGTAEEPMVQLFDTPHEGEEDGEEEDAPESEPAEAAKETAAPEAPKTYEYRPTRYLLHAFTPEEINGFRADREEKDRIIDDLEADLEGLQERVKGLKKRIDTLTDEGRLLSRRVREGSEYRNVPCEERKEPDPREGEPTFGQLMMVTYRLDTNEVIEVRELKGAERQGVLFDQAPAATPAVGNEIREATAPV